MEESLIIVTGNPRRGKTSLVTMLMLENEMNYFSERYQQACSYIKTRNKYRDNKLSLPPQRHVVYANYDIERKYPNMHSYPLSGFEFGVPNQFCPVKPLLPYGVYVFDEAHKYFGNTGENKEMPPWVQQVFDWRGHIFLKIFLITQHYMNINARIRRVADLFIHVVDSIHTFKVDKKLVKSHKFIPGELIKTEVFYYMFDNEKDLDIFLNSETSPKKPLKHVFHGDIRDYYDPNSYATEMEDLSKDFSYFDYSSVDERPEGWSKYKKVVKNG